MIRLERQVDVVAFDAHATVAVGRQRPEFLAVARLAADLGRPLDGATIARELLGGREHVGRRVLDRAVSLGLLERDDLRAPGRLSESGRRALAEGVVLVEEERLWRFYTLVDPLVDEPLIHVAPVDATSAYDERKAVRDEKNGGAAVPRQGDATDATLRAAASKERVQTSLATGGLFSLKRIADRGAKAGGGRLTLGLRCAPGDAPSVSLRGPLASPTGSSFTVDRDLGVSTACRECRYDDLWFALVAGGAGVPTAELTRWRERAGALVLPTPFDDQLAVASRRSFQRTVAIVRPAVLSLGSFDNTRIENVPLVPRSDQDAEAWARWLQWSSLDRYMTPALLDASRRSVLAQFPFHRPFMASDDELLRRARSAPTEAGARFVLAPSDLGLWS